jgi:hypothetical protein
VQEQRQKKKQIPKGMTERTATATAKNQTVVSPLRCASVKMTAAG